MKYIFASFFIAQAMIGLAQPGDAIPCEIAIEYSSLASNLDSLNARYQIVGSQGIIIPENDSLMQPSSNVSYYSEDVMVKINDTLKIVKKAIFSDSGSVHIFLPMLLNRSDMPNIRLYQYTIKIIEKRNRAEMTISLIGKKDDFISFNTPFLEITNLSFSEGVYLLNLNDDPSSNIPRKYNVSKINKRNLTEVMYRSCKISDIKIHAISRRKMKRFKKQLK
jgi:hypothetical protein